MLGPPIPNVTTKIPCQLPLTINIPSPVPLLNVDRGIGGGGGEWVQRDMAGIVDAEQISMSIIIETQIELE